LHYQSILRTMQKLVFIVMSLLMISCSAPKEIVKSETLYPNCHCEGKGNYTIVMDAGMGNWSLFYRPVFQELKKKARICIIDRAGYAMNAVSSKPRDAKTIAFEMDNTFEQNGITNNLILVGHSLGGLHMRMYQSLFPEKVKGIVLLESAHPNQFDRLPSAFYDLQKQQLTSLDNVIKLAQKDYLKYRKGKIPTFGLPDSLLSDYYAVTTKPEYYYTMKLELLEFETSLKQVEKLSDLGSLPLLVIASKNSLDASVLSGKATNYPFAEHNKIWLELQNDLSSLSQNSTFVESEQNHNLNITDSDLVAEQILLFMKNNFYDK
jgi:pimeloyl-ACP methyl ester carboxylesterase